jgi:hypothetical protein
MKKYLLNNKYILIFIGLSIIFYIFYIRIILKRIPKDFTIPKTIYLMLSFFMSIFFIILLIIKVYRYYRLHYPKTNVNNTNRILNFIILRIKDYVTSISTIIFKSLYQVDFIIRDIIPFSGNIVEYTGRLLLKVEKIPRKFLKLKHFISLIVSVIFVIEIIVYKQLDIFYKVLILMLIPLAINYIIYSVKIWVHDQLDSLNDCITVELDDYIDKIITPSDFAIFYCITDDDPVNISVHYVPSYEEYRKSQGMPIQEGLIEIGTFLFFVSDLLFYITLYDKKISLYNETVYPIIPTTLYAIGWLYILISNLYMFFDSITLIKLMIEIGSYLSIIILIYSFYYLLIKEFNNNKL